MTERVEVHVSYDEQRGYVASHRSFADGMRRTQAITGEHPR